MLFKPIDNKYWKITSPFGNRVHPITGDIRFHNGIDLAAPVGTPIIATHDGIIKDASNNICGTGVKIVGDKYTTGFCHLDDYILFDGDNVKAGELIGFTGNTGASTGAHLHFNIRENGNFIDPENFPYYSFTTIPPITDAPNYNTINNNDYNNNIPTTKPNTIIFKPNYKKMIAVFSLVIIGGGLIYLWTRDKNK